MPNSLTLIFVKKNPQLHALPAHQPVVKSNPLKIFIHFIDIYKNLRDSSPDNEVTWLLKNTFLAVKNLAKMIFVDESSNAVTELPHMLAGKIEAKHLVPNTGGHVYVLALSEGTLVSLGFVSLLMICILGYILFIWLLNKFGYYIYKKVISILKSSGNDNQAVDIFSKELSANYNGTEKREPVYLQNYIRNRNAQ